MAVESFLVPRRASVFSPELFTRPLLEMMSLRCKIGPLNLQSRTHLASLIQKRHTNKVSFSFRQLSARLSFQTPFIIAFVAQLPWQSPPTRRSWCSVVPLISIAFVSDTCQYCFDGVSPGECESESPWSDPVCPLTLSPHDWMWVTCWSTRLIVRSPLFINLCLYRQLKSTIFTIHQIVVSSIS